MPAPSWIWLPELKRYRDLATGQFVSADQVQVWVLDSMKASSSTTDTLSQMVSNRQVNLQGWTRAIREEIKGEFIRQYILGRGGLEQMTQVDYGSIGGMLKSEYHPHLDDFAQAIAAGKLSETQNQR